MEWMVFLTALGVLVFGSWRSRPLTESYLTDSARVYWLDRAGYLNLANERKEGD